MRQQFSSQGTITEQQAYTHRYPLQDNFLLDFVDADVADRGQMPRSLIKLKKCSIPMQSRELQKE
jgi:hypothetical protein